MPSSWCLFLMMLKDAVLKSVVVGPLQASPLLGISEPAALTWSTEMWMIRTSQEDRHREPTLFVEVVDVV